MLGASRPSLGTPQLHRPTHVGPPRDTGLDHVWWYRREHGGGGSSYSASTGQALSDGESKVVMSDGEVPVSKSDEVEHMLDKGLWVGTGATQWGWKTR